MNQVWAILSCDGKLPMMKELRLPDNYLQRPHFIAKNSDEQHVS